MSARWATVEAIYDVAFFLLVLASVSFVLLAFSDDWGRWGIPAGVALVFALACAYKSIRAAQKGKGDV